MKKIYLILLLLSITGGLFAQNQQRRTAAPTPAAPPLPTRIVSGVVKDTTETTLIGAIVYLKSTKDSLVTTTNVDGVFVFRDVKEATFTLTVSSMGYRGLVKKMLNNDAVKNLVLDPITLKAMSNQLKEVVINGTPSITYKTDTVEYRASDYKVRENATVDELLKKMEGMEVGTDGSVTHQGQAVVKARLNGKDYAGGDVARAIQNLPADIVEKIQIVDDYGDQAARTGIKDGDPQKVLNITTKADRSVGNILRLAAGAGSQGRYTSNVFGQRINANQQIGINGSFNNTVNGIAGSGGGSGGTTTSGNPSFSYRDYWGKKIQINTNYNYDYNNTNSINESYGNQITANRDPLKPLYNNGETLFTSSSNGQNNSKSHRFSFEFEFTPDSANFLRITPSVNYNSATVANTSSRVQTGYQHYDTKGLTKSVNTTPTLSGVVFYQHIFKKKRRNLSLQLNMSSSNNTQDREQNNHILYYDSLKTILAQDSLVHRLVNRDNLSKNFRTSFTYVEPLSLYTQLEFNAQVNYRGYDNSAITENIDANNKLTVVDSLTNIYNYSFTEMRIALNYRINKAKYNLSLGLTAVPTTLDGQKMDAVTDRYVDTRRNFFNLIPIVRFQYVWSRTERFSISYNGNPTEPTFSEIQPVRDVSNSQNPVVGNPNLKPSFRHSINTEYNHYIANSKLNLSANVNTSFINNQIITNQVIIPDVHGATKNETRFVNLDGSYAVNGNYNISKQLDDRRYNLALNGNVSYSYNVAMSNSVQFSSTTWHYNERFGPRISPNENIEINPYVSYDWSRTFYTLPTTLSTDIKRLALNLDGRFYFLKTFMVNYRASKNYVTGIKNSTTNPLVINLALEKQFFKRKSGTLGIQVFDILKQNNFIQSNSGQYGTTNTVSNALSRYFMVNMRLNLQKWSGSPKRNGQNMRRRGDGSFIEN